MPIGNFLKIFPNPNKGSFKIQIDNEIKNGQIVLINLLGQKILEQEIIQGTNDINTNGLRDGLYNCVLLQDKRQIISRRLLIQ